MRENINGRKAMQMASNNMALQDLSRTHSIGIIDLERQRDVAMAELPEAVRKQMADPNKLPQQSNIVQVQKVIDIQNRISKAYKDKASAIARAESEIKRSQQVGDENARLQTEAQQKEYERQKELAQQASGTLPVKPTK